MVWAWHSLWLNLFHAGFRAIIILELSWNLEDLMLYTQCDGNFFIFFSIYLYQKALSIEISMEQSPVAFGN